MIGQDSIQPLAEVENDSIGILHRPLPFSVHLPQYYREGFFSKDTLFHPELKGERYGVGGDPVPYSTHSDDVVTLLLLSFFVIALVTLSHIRGFLVRQFKSFFYLPQQGTTEITETATEVRFQLFSVVLTSLLIAMLYYFYTIQFIGSNFILQSEYYLIFINLAILLAYYLLKTVAHTIVNLVFFDGKRNRQWFKSYLFITTVEGVLLFPAVFLWAYFDWSVQNVVTYFISVLIFVKLLTFYKCYIIFFRQNVAGLQIILYLCALELVPLLAVWTVLGITANSLKINF